MNSEHTLQHILMQEQLIEGILSIIYRLYISLKFHIFHKQFLQDGGAKPWSRFSS